MRTGPIVGEAAFVTEDVGRLELGSVGAERVHVLQGRVVRPGDEIELLLGDGIWLRGRYDWSRIEARWPGLRVELGGPWESQPKDAWRPAAVMALHPDAILRWRR